MSLALVSWISFGVSYASGSITWRLPLALSGLWSLIVLAVIYPLPESPRWLVREGKIDEAREVLAALNDVAVGSEQVNNNIAEIQESLAATGNGRFWDIFTNGKERLFHRTCLAASGQLFQQLCGINTIAFYVSTIFQQDLGLSAVDSRILGAAVFSWQTLASPIGVLTVDRVGRRKLMLVSCVGMGVCMAVLAGTVSQSHNHAAIIVAGISIFIFSGFFPVGLVLKSMPKFWLSTSPELTILTMSLVSSASRSSMRAKWHLYQFVCLLRVFRPVLRGCSILWWQKLALSALLVSARNSILSGPC